MIRVYKLPDKLTNGFCFDGGNPISFVNVDWFDAPPADMGITLTRGMIEEAIRAKNYFDPTARYLILDDRPNETFVMGQPA